MTDILALGNKIAETSRDLNEATVGGGDYTPPPEGLAMVRFIAYVEVGSHGQRAYKGKPKPDADLFRATFELHGKNYPVTVTESGDKIPFRITVRGRISSSEKSTYYKLFKAMNWEGNATHFSQLLGKPFLGTVLHFDYKGDDGSDRVLASFIDNETGPTIKAPLNVQMDAETGESVAVDLSSRIPPAISPLRLFVWNADPAFIGQLWDSIYIATPEGYERSANVFQDEIRAAKNFKGSPIADYLVSRGVLNVGAVDTAESILGKAADEAAEKPAKGAKTKAKAAKVDPLEALGL